MPIYNQELLKYSGDTSKWWLIHVFGEDYYELPQDGILQPSGSNQYPYTTLCPNYCGLKGSAFIVDARYSVYFTFGTFVPSLEFRKFADVECAIVVPFNSISNQIISVSFSECIALGPVAIPEGSIIFLNRAKVGNVPHYYSTHNIKTTDFTAIDRETKLQQVKTWIKNQDGITAEISLSTNMTFSILADLTIGSLTIKDVHPIEFFKQFTTKSKYQSADVSVGDEVHSYSGQNYRLAAMQCFKKHKGYTDYQDSVFQLFCFHYHSQKVIDWLAKFNNLPIESREYFNKLTRLFYAEWLVYNQDGLSTIFDGVSTRTVQSINAHQEYNEKLLLKTKSLRTLDQLFKEVFSRDPKDQIFKNVVNGVSRKETDLSIYPVIHEYNPNRTQDYEKSKDLQIGYFNGFVDILRTETQQINKIFMQAIATIPNKDNPTLLDHFYHCFFINVASEYIKSASEAKEFIEQYLDFYFSYTKTSISKRQNMQDNLYNIFAITRLLSKKSPWNDNPEDIENKNQELEIQAIKLMYKSDSAKDITQILSDLDLSILIEKARINIIFADANCGTYNPYSKEQLNKIALNIKYAMQATLNDTKIDGVPKMQLWMFKFNNKTFIDQLNHGDYHKKYQFLSKKYGPGAGALVVKI